MKKIAIALTSLVLLAGCATTQPQVTVTETVTAKPQQSSSSSGSNNSSNSMSEDETFEVMMLVVGTPSWFLEGEALDILQRHAKDTCGYIRSGMTKEEITYVLVAGTAGGDEEIVDAMLAASVAATYSYCTEYEGFWD